MAGMTAFVDSIFLPDILSLISLWPIYASSTNLSLARWSHGGHRRYSCEGNR